MNFIFDERASDLPYVEKIWRTHIERAGTFISLAESHGEIVVMKHRGRVELTIRGPETKATPAYCTVVDAEFFGIVFKLGTFMPHLPARRLLDRNDVTLPQASGKSFWLKGSAWQFPDYENADTFVARLVREGLLVHDPIVGAVLQDKLPDMSVRTIQRRFLQATGLTHKTIRQIERAKHAQTLLQQGVPILDVVYQAGYFDQPHLTRSLKHLLGQTPAQIIRMSLEPA